MYISLLSQLRSQLASLVNQWNDLPINHFVAELPTDFRPEVIPIICDGVAQACLLKPWGFKGLAMLFTYYREQRSPDNCKAVVLSEKKHKEFAEGRSPFRGKFRTISGSTLTQSYRVSSKEEMYSNVMQALGSKIQLTCEEHSITKLVVARQDLWKTFWTKLVPHDLAKIKTIEGNCYRLDEFHQSLAEHFPKASTEALEFVSVNDD